MASIAHIPIVTTLPGILDSYRSALAEGYNQQVATGKFSQTTAQVMVGFLSAAVIALRVTGNETWASTFENVASKLHNDWTLFQTEIPALCAALDVSL